MYGSGKTDIFYAEIFKGNMLELSIQILESKF
jgi:hypothetical protein